MRRLSALLAIPLIAGGCSTHPDGSATPGSAPVEVINAGSLAPFESCEQLLDFYIDGARDLVGPYGLDGGMRYAVDDLAAEGGLQRSNVNESGDAAAFAADAGGDSATSAEDADFSGTNNQESGVEEADRVKTNGSTIVAIADGSVQIVDVEDGEVLATVAIDEFARGAYHSEILLAGQTVVVMSTGTVGMSRPSGHHSPRTIITRVDISDPASPTVLGSTRMEGSYRSARLIEDSVRLVMESSPTGLQFDDPRDGSLRAERDAAQTNREVIETSTLDDWVPHVETISADGSRGEVQPLTDCADVSRPDVVSGLNTVSVITLDLAAQEPSEDVDGLAPTSSVSLIASGETVYASTDRLIVATSPWGQWAMPFDTRLAPDGSISTSLHSFDISEPGRTNYVASGQIEGTLINQFALSETDGLIRVATTSETSWSDSQESQSSLFMLAERGKDLVVTGSMGGLGKTERIKSVRYLGPDLAAVVTFRQTDPLYLIHTSDPAEPAVTGELKIPGYSAYLHPIDDDHLLGIGQDADPETGWEEGLQASLFDISDITNPRRVDHLTWPGGYSPVEYDYRAFTAWPATGQFFLPAEIDHGSAEEFAGVVTGSFDGQRLTEGALCRRRTRPRRGALRPSGPS